MLLLFLIFLLDFWSQSDSLYNLIGVNWNNLELNTPNLEYRISDPVYLTPWYQYIVDRKGYEN